MLDLAQALEDQTDLTALCSPKEPPRNELFLPNENYGFANVLKRYAGLDTSIAMKVLIPHGIYLNNHIVADGEAKAPLPAVFSYPAYRDFLWKRHTDKLVIKGSSPFIYALRLVGETDRSRAAGTIFFPAHSTRNVKALSELESLALGLQSLAPEYHPVTVCIYWQDFLHGHHRPFEEAGLRIVSAGHIYDQDFLFRLIHLLSLHKFAGSNSRGSHAYYAVAAGLTYFALGNPPVLEGKGSLVVRDAPALTLEREKEVQSEETAFSLDGLDYRRQQGFADFYLCADRVMNRTELGAALRQCERLDRYGPMFFQSAPSSAGRIPYSLRRKMARVGHLAWRIRRKVRHVLKLDLSRG